MRRLGALVTPSITPFVLAVLTAQQSYLERCLTRPLEPHNAEVRGTDEFAQEKEDALLAASRLLPRGMLWIASCEDGEIVANIVIRPNRRSFRKMWLDMYREKAPPARGKTWMNGV